MSPFNINFGDLNMRIYNAALNIKVLLSYRKLYPKRIIYVLRSYANRNKEDQLFRTIHRKKCSKLDLDSGTYSLNNKTDSSITFNGYLGYSKRYGQYYDRIYNFDCDFSDEGFDTNIYYQKRMEDAGLNPVPVVHSIHNHEVDYYIKQGYETVALGSPQITDFGTLSYIMNKFKGTKIKVHLFGNTSFEFLAYFPIYSCDSSVWAQAARFGEIVWWNPNKKGQNKTERIYIEEYMSHDSKANPISSYLHRAELLKYLYEEIGVTESDLLGYDGTLFKQLVNVHHYLRLEEIINQIHREKGFWTAE